MRYIGSPLKLELQVNLKYGDSTFHHFMVLTFQGVGDLRRSGDRLSLPITRSHIAQGSQIDQDMPPYAINVSYLEPMTKEVVQGAEQLGDEFLHPPRQ